MVPKKRREVEDPNNTWNMQLMAAALRFNVEEAERLIEKGASPAVAREPTPFAPHGNLSPLAAVLLQGDLGEAAMAMVRCLLAHGASLDERIPLPHEGLPSAEALLRDGGGVLAGVKAPAASGGVTAVSAAAAGGSKKAAAPSTADAGAGPVAASKRLSAVPPSSPGSETGAVEEGTVLHYLVALGDHAHLLQLLLLAGMPRDGTRTTVAADAASDARHGEVHWAAEPGTTATSSSEGRVDGNHPPSASTQEVVNVLPHTLLQAINQQFLAHKAAATEAAAAAAAEATTAGGGRSSSRAGLAGAAGASRDRSRSRSASVRATSPHNSTPPRLPILSSMPSPLDRQRLSLAVPGEAPDSTHEVRFDFSTRTTRTGLTAVEMAVEKGDLVAARVLLFYGARLDHARLVNGTQTALARACTTGQVELVELLLDVGAPLSQLSHDGRYTLIHYAVGQPAVLEYLVRRGLSMEAENAQGDSALISLLRYGTGRNDAHAVREAADLGDVEKLAALPSAALRNYILMPLPPVVPQGGGPAGGGGASASKKNGAAGGSARAARGVSFAADKAAGGGSTRPAASGGSAGEADAVAFARMGGRELGTWWSFTSLSTVTLIGHVLEAGANFHGHVPDEELGLAFVRFGEDELARQLEGRAPGDIHAGQRQGRLSQKRTSTNSVSSRHSRGHASSPLTAAADEASVFGASATEDSHGQSLDADELVASADASRSSSLTRSSFRARQPATTAGDVLSRAPLRLTPLMHAMVNYHPEVIAKFVLEYKVDLTRRDSTGATALHYACDMVPQNNVSVLRLLLDVLAKESGVGSVASHSGAGGALSGAVHARQRLASPVTATPVELPPFDINAVDMAGLTPLMRAAACGNDAAVALLLNTVSGGHHTHNGASMLLAGLQDTRGRTALHWAVEANAPRVVELLIRHSAAVAEAALGQGTEGLLASLGVGTSGASFAGSAGSRSGTRGRATSPSTLSTQQRRASAASSTNTSAAPAPMSPYAAVDIEAEESEHRMTALELAMKGDRHCDGAILRVLLREGNANYYRPSGLATGGTLLHYAVTTGNVDAVQALLDQYADPNEVDDSDQTPLFLVVEALGKLNASTHGSAAGGDTEADTARLPTRAAWLAILDALLRAGALVHAQSMDSLDTPLHLTATAGARDVLERLFFMRTSHGGVSRGGDDDGGVHGSGVSQRVRSLRRVPHPRAATEPAVADAPSLDGGEHEADDALSSSSSPALLIPLSSWLLSNSRDETPLHLLCARDGQQAQADAVPVLEQLLRTPSPSSKDALGESHTAVEDEMRRERLLNQMDRQGRTALHAACRSHFVEAVVLLLAARPQLVFAVDARGWTPLHDAVAFGAEAIKVNDEKRHERLVAVLEALAATVNAHTSNTTHESAPLPWSWKGLSAAPRADNAAAAVSLTAQIREHHRRECQWRYLRSDAYDSTDGGLHDVAVATPQPDARHALRSYAARVDEHGRSAFLLAGDVGNTAAAKALLHTFS